MPTRAALLSICAAATLATAVCGAPAEAQEGRGEMIALTNPVAPVRRAAVDIEALTLASDFTVFMDRSCPEDLRLKALRRLWSLLPPIEVAENSAI